MLRDPEIAITGRGRNLYLVDEVVLEFAPDFSPGPLCKRLGSPLRHFPMGKGDCVKGAEHRRRASLAAGGNHPLLHHTEKDDAPGARIVALLAFSEDLHLAGTVLQDSDQVCERPPFAINAREWGEVRMDSAKRGDGAP